MNLVRIVPPTPYKRTKQKNKLCTYTYTFHGCIQFNHIFVIMSRITHTTTVHVHECNVHLRSVLIHTLKASTCNLGQNTLKLDYVKLDTTEYFTWANMYWCDREKLLGITAPKLGSTS